MPFPPLHAVASLDVPHAGTSLLDAESVQGPTPGPPVEVLDPPLHSDVASADGPPGAGWSGEVEPFDPAPAPDGLLGPHDEAALRVALVGDDPLAMRGLRRLVDEARGLATVAELTVATGDLDHALTTTPADIALWDAASAAPEDRDAFDDAPLPTLVLVDGPPLADEILAGGTVSLVDRDVDPATLAAAARAAHQGLIVMSPGLAERVVQPASRAVTGWTERPEDVLTSRERDVLERLAEGLTNRGIAERLGIRENTVKFHLRAVLDKLGAASRTEAVVLAARRGFLAL